MLSKLVEDDICPHFPLFYKSLECDQVCIKPECPKNTNDKYKCIFNELADTSFDKFLAEEQSYEVIKSIIHQMYVALYCIHTMNLMHNDVHAANVLIHKITPGGYWHYKVDSMDFYIENKGWMAVLWDFDSMSKMTEHNKNKNIPSYYKNEYHRLTLASEIHDQNKKHLYTILKDFDRNPISSCDLKTFHVSMIKPEKCIKTYNLSKLLLQK